MGKFFNLDSPIMRVLATLADMCLLNLMTLIGCIPIVTAGASITAMHYVLLKMVRNKEGYIWKDFWKSFKAFNNTKLSFPPDTPTAILSPFLISEYFSTAFRIVLKTFCIPHL